MLVRFGHADTNKLRTIARQNSRHCQVGGGSETGRLALLWTTHCVSAIEAARSVHPVLTAALAPATSACQGTGLFGLHSGYLSGTAGSTDLTGGQR